MIFFHIISLIFSSSFTLIIFSTNQLFFFPLCFNSYFCFLFTFIFNLLFIFYSIYSHPSFLLLSPILILLHFSSYFSSLSLCFSVSFCLCLLYFLFFKISPLPFFPAFFPPFLFLLGVFLSSLLFVKNVTRVLWRPRRKGDYSYFSSFQSSIFFFKGLVDKNPSFICFYMAVKAASLTQLQQ